MLKPLGLSKKNGSEVIAAMRKKHPIAKKMAIHTFVIHRQGR